MDQGWVTMWFLSFGFSILSESLSHRAAEKHYQCSGAKGERWELSLSFPSFLTMYWGLKLSSVAYLIPSLTLWLSLGGNNRNTSLLLCSDESSYIPVLQTISWISSMKICASRECINMRFWMKKNKNVFFKKWKKMTKDSWGKSMLDFWIGSIKIGIVYFLFYEYL